jgi:protein tyrosine phosphatase (PTP) superfamily phosphohydrolase (DUF442 family)
MSSNLSWIPTINDLTFVAYSGARIVGNWYYVTGQPSEEAFTAFDGAGIKSVVCVRSPSETAPATPPVPPVPPFDANEETELAQFGVSYVNIPIERSMSQSDFDVAATNAAMTLYSNAQSAPALVHCSTGDRASSVFAVLLMLVLKWTPAQAAAYAQNCLLLANDQIIALVLGYTTPSALASEAAALEGALPNLAS